MLAKIPAFSLVLLPLLIFCRTNSVTAEEGGKGRGKGKGHSKGSDDDRGPAPKRQKPDRKATDEDAGDSQRTEPPASTQATSASSPASNEVRTPPQPNREPPATTTQATPTPSNAPSTSAAQSDAPPAAALPAPPVAPLPEAAAPLPSATQSSDDRVPQGWENWTPARRERWQEDFIASMETIGLYAEARGLTPAEKERWTQSLQERAMKGADLTATTKEISKAIRAGKSKEDVMHE